MFTDLWNIKPKEKNGGYIPIAYYHGFNALKMFTYHCGYCDFPINETDKNCKYCNNKIIWEGESDTILLKE